MDKLKTKVTGSEAGKGVGIVTPTPEQLASDKGVLVMDSYEEPSGAVEIAEKKLTELLNYGGFFIDGSNHSRHLTLSYHEGKIDQEVSQMRALANAFNRLADAIKPKKANHKKNRKKNSRVFEHRLDIREVNFWLAHRDVRVMNAKSKERMRLAADRYSAIVGASEPLCANTYKNDLILHSDLIHKSRTGEPVWDYEEAINFVHKEANCGMAFCAAWLDTHHPKGEGNSHLLYLKEFGDFDIDENGQWIEKPSNIYKICHHYQIGNQDVYIESKTNPTKAAVYIQYMAEEWFGHTDSLNNIAIANALISLYGCIPAAADDYANVIDLYHEREEHLSQYQTLMDDKSLYREHLKTFIEPHKGIS